MKTIFFLDDSAEYLTLMKRLVEGRCGAAGVLNKPLPLQKLQSLIGHTQ